MQQAHTQSVAAGWQSICFSAIRIWDLILLLLCFLFLTCKPVAHLNFVIPALFYIVCVFFYLRALCPLLPVLTACTNTCIGTLITCKMGHSFMGKLEELQHTSWSLGKHTWRVRKAKGCQKKIPYPNCIKHAFSPHVQMWQSWMQNMLSIHSNFPLAPIEILRSWVIEIWTYLYL